MSKRLTPAQQKVMEWLDNGWTTEPGNGLSIHVNGKRICNLDTMTALQRAGLVEQIVRDGFRQIGEWKATEKPNGGDLDTEQE